MPPTRAVFISSTFRDLHAERDQLNLVFPAVAERLAESGRTVELEPIDLRVGVETAGEPETVARERLVLKVCLAEVERSRPYLLVVLGDRYGCILGDDPLRAASREAGLDEAVALGKSVTALEIEFGIVARADSATRVRVYLRRRLDYDAMPPEARAKYSDEHSGDAGSAEKLRRLKESLAERFPDRVRWYDAHWDRGSGRLTGLDAFREQVIEDLTADISAEIGADAPAATWQSAERRNLESFVEAGARGFAGREGTLSDLVRFATEGAGAGLVLAAPPGAGKSAVFARLVERLGRDPNVLLLAHAAGVSPRSTQVHWMVRRWVDELTLAAGDSDLARRVTDETPWDEVEKAFRTLLSDVASSRRVVLLVDALEQFERTPSGMPSHAWLPDEIPGNVRVIVTGVPTGVVLTLVARQDFVCHDLPPLAPDDGRSIVARVLLRYHRSFGPRVIAALLAKEVAPGVLACGNPLWLVTALEELNLLDEDDFARMEAAPMGASPAERIDSMLLAVVAALPNDVARLYGALLERLEGVHGRRQVAGLSAAVALGRLGWRERDLLTLVPQVGLLLAPEAPDRTVDILRLAHLRRSLRAHLVRRSAEGTWTFFHAQAREAIRKRYIGRDSAEAHVHAAIAEFLVTLPEDDPLRRSETMFHCIAGDDRARAASTYRRGPDVSRIGESAAFAEVDGATLSLMEHVAAHEGETPNPGFDWAVSLLDAAGIDPEARARLAHRMLAEVHPLLLRYHRVDAREEHGFLKAIETRLLDVLRSRPDVEVVSDVFAAQLAAGDVLDRLGDDDAAAEQFRAADEIAARLVELEPTSARWQYLHSFAPERLGFILKRRGEPAGALDAFEIAYSRGASAHALDAANPIIAQGLCRMAIHLGDLRRERRDRSGAETAYRDALRIAEELRSTSPIASLATWEESRIRVALGELAEETGKGVEALAQFRAAHALSEDLVREDPAVEGSTYQRALAMSKLGDGHRAHGDLAAAARAYRDALGAAEESLRADPEDRDWARGKIDCLFKLGEILRGGGDLAGAWQTIQQALTVLAPLGRSAPDDPTWRRALALGHERLGHCLLESGDFAPALQAFQSSLTTREQLAASDPENPHGRRDVATSHMLVGDALASSGELPAALEAYRRGIRMTEALVAADPENAQWRRDEWVGHFRFGQVQEHVDPVAASATWRRARELVSAAQREGVGIGPEDAPFLAELAVKAGGASDRSVPTDAQGAPAVPGHAIVEDLRDPQAIVFAAQPTPMAGQEMGLDELRRRAATDAEGCWQRELVLALTHLGEDARVVGDGVGAVAHWEEARQVGRRLGARDPTNAQWRRDLLVVESKLGDMQFARGDLLGATSTFTAALDAARRLVALDPESSSARRDLAVNLNRLGGILLASGGAQRGREMHTEAMAIGRELSAAEPASRVWRHDLTGTLDRLGDAESACGDAAAAERSYAESRAILDVLVREEPTNWIYEKDLANLETKLASARAARGDVASSLESSKAAHETLERLAAAHPASTELRRMLGVSWLKSAEIAAANHDAEAALAEFARAREVIVALASVDPANLIWQRDLLAVHLGLGELRSARGEASEALTSHEEALRILRKLVRATPSDLTWRGHLHRALWRVADARESGGDSTAALAAYTEAATSARELAAAHPDAAGWQKDLFIALTRSADLTCARGDEDSRSGLYEAALVPARRAAMLDPRDSSWRGVMAKYLHRLGFRKNDSKDLVGALAAFREALALAMALADEAPSDADRLRDVGRLHEACGRAAADMDRADEAREHLRAARVAFEKPVQSGTSDSVTWLRLAGCCYCLGLVDLRLGDATEANQSLGRAFQILTGLRRAGVPLPPASERDLDRLEKMRRRSPES